MSFAVTYPYLLLLLPLAALPLVFSAQEEQPYPSLESFSSDTVSAVVDLLLRILGVIAIAATVVGLAGPYRLDQSIERLGEGANIVLLFDRSASMNDSFAGQAPTQSGEESKSSAARRFLKDFVERREHDRFGVAAFSTSPMFVLPLSSHKEATLGAIDAIALPGLAYTNVGTGLALALAMQETDIRSTQAKDGGVASRAIVLVSDGAAVIDRKLQQKLEASFTRRPLSLYWIFLRTEGSRGLYDKPEQGRPDTPYAMPERHLNMFFENLKIPYKAFEVENPAAVGEAIAAIDELERRPLRYQERIPQKDLAHIAYGVGAGALLLLLLAKLAEARVATPRSASARARSRAGKAAAIVLLIAAGALPQPTDAGELTREQVIAVLSAAKDGERPNLTRRDLTGIDLSGVDFKRADLFAAILSGSMLQGANLAGASLGRVVANQADFSDANFEGADMFAVVMHGADLTGANLSSARIIGELKDARMDKAKLVKADLGADPANQGMVPVRVDMSGVSLVGADLTDANLIHTVLSYARMRDAVLVRTRFNWAKLAGADLAGADVTGADFSDAELDGASLSDLKGADSAKGLPQGQ